MTQVFMQTNRSLNKQYTSPTLTPPPILRMFSKILLQVFSLKVVYSSPAKLLRGKKKNQQNKTPQRGHR